MGVGTKGTISCLASYSGVRSDCAPSGCERGNPKAARTARRTARRHNKLMRRSMVCLPLQIYPILPLTDCRKTAFTPIILSPFANGGPHRAQHDNFAFLRSLLRKFP